MGCGLRYFFGFGLDPKSLILKREAQKPKTQNSEPKKQKTQKPQAKGREAKRGEGKGKEKKIASRILDL